MENKDKNKSFIFLKTISAIIILGICFNLIYLCFNQNHFNYWTIFWACIASISVPLSGLGALYKYQKDQSELQNSKSSEMIKNVISDLYPNFICAKNIFNYSNDEKDKFEAIRLGTTILSNINLLQSAPYNFKIDDTDLDIYKKDTTTVLESLSEYPKEYLNDFTVLNSLDDPVDNNNPLADDNHLTDNEDNNNQRSLKTMFDNPENVLIVRTRGNDKESMMGNWKISPARASKLEYIIGIHGSMKGPKEYIGTYKIDKVNNVGENRFKFEGTSADKYDKDEAFKKNILTALSNWTAMNPVRYLGNLGN